MALKTSTVLSLTVRTSTIRTGRAPRPWPNLLRRLRPSSEAYANVEILLNTRATALLMADGYTCQGVQVFADGVYTDIVAKAVFLCTGGMATNFDLLRFFTNH